jgi:hypothetical protein
LESGREDFEDRALMLDKMKIDLREIGYRIVLDISGRV